MQGSIVKRTLKDGSKRYFAVFRAGGKQTWKGFPRRKDAERFLASTVKSVNEGTYTEVKPLLLNDVFDRWLSHSLEVRLKQGLLKPSTAKSYRSMLASHLRPFFGEHRSDRLSHAVVADWVRHLADKIETKTMSAHFYNHLLNLFHSILAWARHPAQGYLAHDPMIGQKRLPKRQAERDFLEPEEIEKLLRAAEPPDDTLLHLAAFTGLRRGELFGLQWGDIDWGNGTDGGRLRIRRSIYQGAITTPKTKNSIRVVDVPQRTLDEMAMYKLGFPTIGEGFVFRGKNGRPIDSDNWTKRDFLPIIENAELRRIGLHVLRHTYASLLINAGESIMYVSRQLGHGSIQVTADIYGHLFKETSLAAMRRLEQQIPSNKNLTEEAKTAKNTVEQDGMLAGLSTEQGRR
ncbi:MAG: site-specific integrase [Acidobacteria bacterium]|nr:site-specific integrase [Acidobacteriota bacterium]